MVLRVEYERVRRCIGAIYRFQGGFQHQGKRVLPAGTGAKDVNLAGSRANSNPFAIAACCKVATAQIIQRITFQPLIANESYKPAFRCIPYTCTTLVPGN